MAEKDVCKWHEDRSAIGYCAFCGRPVCDECHNGAFCKLCTNRTIRGIGGIPKSRKKALLYAIFLGWLGVHRYYMGFYFTGVIYTLTLGVGGLASLVDIIRILFWSTIREKEQPYYSERYNCTIGIKIQGADGSLSESVRGILDTGVEGALSMMNSDVRGILGDIYDKRFWRDKDGRPLLRSDQEKITELVE